MVFTESELKDFLQIKKYLRWSWIERAAVLLFAVGGILSPFWFDGVENVALTGIAVLTLSQFLLRSPGESIKRLLQKSVDSDSENLKKISELM